ncbi:MAG: histidine phosphatase family protein, partial [Patescibacteria group bacterium]
MTLPGTLIIARHHESEWNKLGLWTGTRDVHLTPYGLKKSEEMGELIKDLPPDYAFASTLVRTDETLIAMLKAFGIKSLDGESSPALNERDYGDYTGKDKLEMEKLVGEETFDKIRREWNYPIPHGETLKMVYERVVPFYIDTVLPLLKSGHTVLVVSHGNALRALEIYIESISTAQAHHLEMLFGTL